MLVDNRNYNLYKSIIATKYEGVPNMEGNRPREGQSNLNMMDKLDQNIGNIRPSIFVMGLLYTISNILLLVGSRRIKISGFYNGILFGEIVFILIPTIIIMWGLKYKFRTALRINPMRISTTILIPIVMIFSLPVVNIINVIVLAVINKVFGRIQIQGLPIQTGNSVILVAILSICVAPAVCEEFLFRGVLMRGFERFGITIAILISSFLFGISHMDFQKFVGTFLLGVLIGFIVYRTNSIWGEMIAHFTNNLIALILSLFRGVSNNYKNVPDQQVISFEDIFKQAKLLAPTDLAITIGAMIFVIMFLIALFALFVKIFVKNTSKDFKQIDKKKLTFRDKLGLLWFCPMLCIIGIVYAAEGLKLLNKQSYIINSILKFIGVE